MKSACLYCFLHFKLRAGNVDGQPASSTTAMNAQSAQSASKAKVKTLPALQANSDPFGAGLALTGWGKVINFINPHIDIHACIYPTS